MNFLREVRAILSQDRSGSPQRSASMTPLSLTSNLSPSSLWWTNQALTLQHKPKMSPRHATDSKTNRSGCHQNVCFTLLPQFTLVKFTGKWNFLTNEILLQMNLSNYNLNSRDSKRFHEQSDSLTSLNTGQVKVLLDFHDFGHDCAFFESRKPRGSNGVNRFNILRPQRQLLMEELHSFTL